MACGARSGLKQLLGLRKLYILHRLNGLWSPFGFETCALLRPCEKAGMACGARSGLIDKKIPTRFSSGCFVFSWSFRLFSSYLAACLIYSIVPSTHVAQSSTSDV